MFYDLTVFRACIVGSKELGATNVNPYFFDAINRMIIKGVVGAEFYLKKTDNAVSSPGKVIFVDIF